MEIAILAFDGMTALDAVGPAQVLSFLPGAAVRWVAREPGARRTDAGTSVVADHSLSDAPRPDVFLVPGGVDVRSVMADRPVLEWLRAADRTTRYTTSVCTGALVLGAAGLLEGRRATTHWAMLDRLGKFGATPTTERVVVDGKTITAAGVSAGVDMALHGNWVGIDGPGRVMIAQALFSNFGGPGRFDEYDVADLCNPDELSRAAHWGLAMRLGQRLSGGVASSLERSSLSLNDGKLVLTLDAKDESLYGEAVDRRLRTLANALGYRAEAVIE